MNSPAAFIPRSIEPTPEQTAIQTSGDLTIVVRANAGAAKTTTLALRIAESLARGVPPERVLALTYTEPACEALAAALHQVGVSSEIVGHLRIHTFEQFAEKMLLSVERRKVPRRTSPETLAPVVWQALEQLDLGVEAGFTERFLAADRRLKGTLAHDLLLWAGRRVTAEVAEEAGLDPVLLKVFAAFEGIRYPRGDHCDHPLFRGGSDATYDLARLLGDPETSTPLHEIGAWPWQIEDVLVDEMHDLNLAMFIILKALLRTRAVRFCGVGDHDQVVHATAGAEQRFMASDVDLGPGRRVHVYPLTATRRFSPALATLAGRLAGKKYASDSSHRTQVACRSYGEEPDACAAQVVTEALACGDAGHAADMAGLAVLLRRPSQSVAIENALLHAGLAYRTVGFHSYLMQPEVLLIRALLAVATGDYAQLESEATRRALVRAVVSFCGVRLSYDEIEGESAEERLQKAVSLIAADASLLKPFLEFQVLTQGEPAVTRRLKAALQACKAAGPDLLPRCLDALDMGRMVQTVFVEEQRRADAQAYMAGLTQAARAFTTAEAFFHSLNRSETQLRRTASVRTTRQKETMLNKKSIVVSTVEAAKGLEYDHVVMPYLSQEEFPSRLAASLGEERNLFYVGITRARRALTLLADRRRPSEFLLQAGVQFEPSGDGLASTSR